MKTRLCRFLRCRSTNRDAVVGTQFGFMSLLLNLVLVLPVAAEEVSPQGVGEAMSGSEWFDASADQIKAVPVANEFSDTVHRESRWLPQAKRVVRPSAPAAQNSAAAGGSFWSGLTLANLFGYALLLTILLLLVFALSKALAGMEDAGRINHRGRSRVDGEAGEDLADRIDQLPAELRRTDVNLRDEAERLMRIGQFDRAIVLLFGHQLILLDRGGYLRLARGKTNRRYVRETTTSDRAVADDLTDTVDAFEESYFGRHDITADRFADLWAANRRIESAVRQRREAA